MALASVSNARTKTPSATSKGFSPIGVQIQPVNRQVQRSQQIQQAQKAQQPNRGFQPGNRQIQRANQQFQQSNTQSQSSNREYKSPVKASSSGRSESPLNEARRLSSTAKAPASISPLPTAQSPQFPQSQRAPRIPSARSISPLARSAALSAPTVGSALKSLRGFRPGLGGTATILDLLGQALYKSQGWKLPASHQENAEALLRDINSGESERQSRESQENFKEGLDNFPRNLRDAFNDLFDRLADPFKRHPRTDPKNDDGRPKPTRHAYDWRGIKFWSPNNGGVIHQASYKGQYTLGATFPRNDASAFRYSSESVRTFTVIYYDILLGDIVNGQQVYYSRREESTCEPDTIEPDPEYIPPSIGGNDPLLTPPGTIPIPDYPPIFTEDDFKPQRQRNDDRARQDEADRQAEPDQNQQRRDENDRQRQTQPDPWESPIPSLDPGDETQPTPQPYPYPLDSPSPDLSPDPTATPDTPNETYPDTTIEDRLRERAERIRDRLNERFPAPEINPQPEVTINGEPINQRSSLPSPNLTPRRDSNPQPEVTINGSPVPRPGEPLPETRTRTETQTPTNTNTTTSTETQTPTKPDTKSKPPTQTRIDPETGKSPLTESETPTQEPTPEKCKDPCMQGLHDKADAKAGKDLVVKLFKSCSKPVPEGQTVKTPEIDFEEKTIKVPGDEFDAYKHLYERLYALECEQCGDPVAIASVPEWWQVRRNSGTPQLTVLFAEQFSSGKLGGSRWTLSIPHYNRPKGARPNIPTYNKGNWFGTLRLSDGSKLGINAASSSECKRVLNRLKIHIPVEFRTKNGKAIKPRIVEDPSADLKECKVTPVRADYYSKGQTNMTPDWTINLRRK